MKILIDTNVFISAILWPNSLPAKALEKVIQKYNIALCSQIIEELNLVFERKFKNKLPALKNFLNKLSFELIETPSKIDINKYPSIRDNSDLPILASAIIGNVDIIITGDKDFSDIDIEKPEILTPKEFLEKFD